MFRYFPSKEKLLEEVIASFSFIPVLQTLQCEANDRTCEETLKLMAEALLDALLHRKEWVILMHSEVRRNPQKLLGIYHSFLDRLLGSLAAYLRAEQEKGTLRSIDPDIAARALYGMVFCYFNTEEVLLRKEYCPTDRRVAMHEFVQLFMRGASA